MTKMISLRSSLAIQIATSSNYWASPYWDSTKTLLTSSTTPGNRISDISYSGNDLATSTTYYWRIKFWDDGDFEGSWSTATSSLTTITPGIQTIFFDYDNVGNIYLITDISNGGLEKTIQFLYDSLYRLTTASTTDAYSNPFNQTYTYNAIGNITNKSDQGNYTYSETGYANPHAVTNINGTTYNYDNNGNITGIGSNTYVWDYKNRLTSSTVSSNTDYYTYDHNNIRTTKTNNTATTTYPNMYYNTDGATVTKHIFDPITGDLLATVEGNGTATTTQYIHTDHLGGTNVVTNESGDVVETVDYYPFGEQRISEVTSGNAEQKKFTGHEFDSDTDLTYAKQRYYDQDVGRWLSQDVVFLNIGVDERTEKVLQDPQLANAYSYGRNNPITYIDKEGEFTWMAAVIPTVGFGGTYYEDIRQNQREGLTGIQQFTTRDNFISRGLMNTGDVAFGYIVENPIAGGLEAFTSSLAWDYAQKEQFNYTEATKSGVVGFTADLILGPFKDAPKTIKNDIARVISSTVTNMGAHEFIKNNDNKKENEKHDN